MSAKLRGVVLTKDILFGMNLLSLAGFLVMVLSLTYTARETRVSPWALG
jgi:hypothetical protein